MVKTSGALPTSIEREIADACELIAESPVTPPGVLEVVVATAEALSCSRRPDADCGQLHDLLELQSAALGALLVLGRPDPERRSALRVELERMRQAVSNVRNRDALLRTRPTWEIVNWLEGSAGLALHHLSALLGVQIRTLKNWAAPDGPRPNSAHERRLRTVALLVSHLRHALGPEGIVLWFERQRRELGGRAARELLGDPERLFQLESLARGVRAHLAT